MENLIIVSINVRNKNYLSLSLIDICGFTSSKQSVTLFHYLLPGFIGIIRWPLWAFCLYHCLSGANFWMAHQIPRSYSGRCFSWQHYSWCLPHLFVGWFSKKYTRIPFFVAHLMYNNSNQLFFPKLRGMILEWVCGFTEICNTRSTAIIQLLWNSSFLENTI